MATAMANINKEDARIAKKVLEALAGCDGQWWGA